MIDFDSIKQGVIAALAAIIFTATAVGAAVGPARLAETAPVQIAEARTDVAARG